ncbi:class I SAM-dependent methyltransferase [Halorussus halophilus]|uniref:class I SAM-dependent methyltransferase n=1 Tax=Halorussus halophilus TaxID=2650975 RepID=UPI00130147B2|nr:methyltransferase domain-containing protein [Halorussus halophilus]
MTDSVGDVAFFDRFARYFDWFNPQSGAEKIRAGLAFAERDVERVLDVGGGTGRGASAVGASERLVADAAPGMLREARKKGMEAVRADGANLPFADESVDAVLVVDALHHFGDPEGAVSEMARVLRPGGVLVVREFDPTVLVGKLVVASEHLFGFDSTFFAPDDLTRKVRATGLDARYRTDGYEYTVAGVK